MADRASASPSGASDTKAPILIIEDEPDLIGTYERLLRRLHYDVIAAERGADGIRLGASRPLALVVTDLKLPDVDGLTVVRAMRALPAPPPVIVVSAWPGVEARRAALDAGAAAYLAKPFAVSALIGLIQAALKDSDASRAAVAPV